MDAHLSHHVAYLGPVGTYSEEAARLYFTDPETQFTPSAKLDEVVSLVENGQAAMGILPIENSTGGTVHRTLDLLFETKLRISGEVLLPIHHQLLTHAAGLEDIATVGAHPQALAQCRNWLDAHLPAAAQSAAASNAAAARIAESDPTYAAIASTQAAARYDLPILAANIEDEATNTTRFVIIGNQNTQPTGTDKTSIMCGMPHVTGSLHRVLGALVEHDVNLTKIESRPITSKPWEYMFFIDMEGHAGDSKVSAALDELTTRASFIKVLGSYAAASVTY
jgi:chorismate mutase/prephenate dehydratase